MLFDELINALVATFVVADLNHLAVVAKMNAGSLSGVIIEGHRRY